MKHYQKPDGNGAVWAFEPDGSQDHLITEDMTPCDPPAPPPPPSQAELALAQIRALEAAHADNQARMTRVALLDLTLREARSILIAQAQEQGASPEAIAAITPEAVHAQLMLLPKGYAEMFQLEQQIAALRDQL